MDIRESFSRLKKKLNYPLSGRKSKPGRTGADAGGERVDPTGSVSQPLHRVVAGGGHGREEDEADAGGRQDSTDRPLQPGEPESVQALGSENDQEEEEPDIDGKELSQRLVGSGLGREENDPSEENVERVYPSPSIPHSGKPDST